MCRVPSNYLSLTSTEPIYAKTRRATSCFFVINCMGLENPNPPIEFSHFVFSTATEVMSDNPDAERTVRGNSNGSTRAPRGRSANRSSPQPSEINGALSDVEGFPDDEIVGARGTDRNRPRDPLAQAIPKVVDRVGEKVAEEFENFLEKYALMRLN